MNPSINQLQPPDDEQAEALTSNADESSEIGYKPVHQLSQGTFFSYCHHQFDQLDNGSMSNHKKMQENSDLSSKRRKTEIIKLHNSRIVRSNGRKDRHSKVCTSKGPKDRRVRLAPGTAIQFYDVQDRLGYDRPSKAIDWLMQEAKSAIDLLDAAADQSPINGKIMQMQKLDHLKNSENPISGFSDSVNGPVHSEFRTWPDGNFNSYQDGFFSALTTPSQIFETNLQRIFANTEYSVMNTLPLQFTGPVLGPNQIFTQREPLQSSFINYPPNNSEFQGLNFYSEELSCFTAGETVKGKDKIPLVSSKPSFQHKED